MGNDVKIQPGNTIYFVGIKGTGVCALAELMNNAGMKVSGSDTPEEFYTDAILKELNITFFENFDAARINKNIDMVIYSAAYNPETHPEIVRALELGIPVLKYSDALGAWSQRFESAGICGVHGKTTTTAIVGVCARAAGLPAQILTGSAAIDFGGRSTLNLGNKYFIAETCEYRGHFLSFHPKVIVLTSVESDHQDFFPDYDSIRDIFVEYCRLLPKGGQLIYCADDSGAKEVAAIIEKEDRGIELIPYGFSADGGFQIHSYNVASDHASFFLKGMDTEFVLNLPGRHQALNAAAGIALVSVLTRKEFGAKESLLINGCETGLNQEKILSIKKTLMDFKGTKRRSEIKGEAGGIIFMDDYGHHPTAIMSTLAGIKSFYSSRRIIVSFMSHTYSRTAALADEFANSFNDADVLFLHKIYASARDDYKGKIDGKALYEKTASVRDKEIYYVDEPDNAYEQLCAMLKSGDLFITLGAGNNWTLGDKLFAHFGGK